jgi:hypothetical protein
VSEVHRPAWAPDSIDIETPSVARMYDYLLDGSHNFAADRELAEEARRAFPHAREYCLANRAFLTRAVATLVGLGVRQFLDLGSGIPTASNVHEVAHAADTRARTVYVDCDPVAFAHGHAILREVPHATIVQHDLRDPAAVLADPHVVGFLDFSRPVAVLLSSVLPFIPDEDDPAALVAAYRDATVPGSYLAISHGTRDYQDTGELSKVYERASHQVTPRTREEIMAMLDGYELLEPGLTDAISWRPDPLAPPDPFNGDVRVYSLYAAVGRKDS